MPDPIAATPVPTPTSKDSDLSAAYKKLMAMKSGPHGSPFELCYLDCFAIVVNEILTIKQKIGLP